MVWTAPSRFITFSVPKALLGTPSPGWGFTVVLTGQDGFSSDQAHGFAATPQPFLFGVCAAASADPHCTFDPGAVPKAVDLVTAPGVQQSTELDYTLGPVVLTGVTIPQVVLRPHRVRTRACEDQASSSSSTWWSG